MHIRKIKRKQSLLPTFLIGFWKLLNRKSRLLILLASEFPCPVFPYEGDRGRRRGWITPASVLFSLSKEVVCSSLPPLQPWHAEQQRNSLINVNWNRAISWKPFAEPPDCPGLEVFLYSFIMIYGFGQHTHRREIVDMWNPSTENLSFSPSSVHQVNFCLFKDYRGFGC